MSDEYVRMIPIPGGYVRLRFLLSNGCLDGMDYHSSAKLRVRLDWGGARNWELHVYRAKKVLGSWRIFAGSTEVSVERVFVDESAWGSHRYGQGRKRRAVLPSTEPTATDQGEEGVQ